MQPKPKKKAAIPPGKRWQAPKVVPKPFARSMNINGKLIKPDRFTWGMIEKEGTFVAKDFSDKHNPKYKEPTDAIVAGEVKNPIDTIYPTVIVKENEGSTFIMAMFPSETGWNEKPKSLILAGTLPNRSPEDVGKYLFCGMKAIGSYGWAKREAFEMEKELDPDAIKNADEAFSYCVSRYGITTKEIVKEKLKMGKWRNLLSP